MLTSCIAVEPGNNAVTDQYNTEEQLMTRLRGTHNMTILELPLDILMNYVQPAIQSYILETLGCVSTISLLISKVKLKSKC